MAEETKEEVTSEQESPTVEQKPVEEQPADKPVVEESTDADRNWRAIREENERLKKELAGKQEQASQEIAPDVAPLNSVRSSPAVSFYLAPEVQNQLQFEEFKAEQAFPGLENDSLFAESVAGKYRRALDEYVGQLANGITPRFIPSAYRIAKEADSAWKARFGDVLKKGEEEGARKVKQSVSDREATTEAEGRSDRGRLAEESSDLSTLRRKTQEGNMDAIAARLSRLK